MVGGPCTTQHGCCNDKKTAKEDKEGSNCAENTKMCPRMFFGPNSVCYFKTIGECPHTRTRTGAHRRRRTRTPHRHTTTTARTNARDHNFRFIPVGGGRPGRRCASAVPTSGNP